MRVKICAQFRVLLLLSCVCRAVQVFAHWHTHLRHKHTHTHTHTHTVSPCLDLCHYGAGCLSLYVWRTVSRGHCSSMGDRGRQPRRSATQSHRLQASTPRTWQSCQFRTGSRAWNKAHESVLGANNCVFTLNLTAQRWGVTWLMQNVVIIHGSFVIFLVSMKVFTKSCTFWGIV